MYETTTDAAAQIRAAFKARGWTSRQIGVRAEHFSLGSAIKITLKDGSISVPLVKRIAEEKEKIHRCEVTGEILGGGNRYVNVHLTSEAITIKARRYIGQVEQAIALLPNPAGSTLQPITNNFYLGRDQWEQDFTLWDDSLIGQGRDAESIAYLLAVRVEEQEAMK